MVGNLTGVPQLSKDLVSVKVVTTHTTLPVGTSVTSGRGGGGVTETTGASVRTGRDNGKWNTGLEDLGTVSVTGEITDIDVGVTESEPYAQPF